MASKRMFALAVIDTDKFLEMPLSTQALYFHLSMRADDDGFIDNPKNIKRMTGASDNDLDLLLVKQFIIPFDSGVCVIRHWRMHNYIQKDRYHETIYKNEKQQLKEDNKVYLLKGQTPINIKENKTRIQSVSKPYTDCTQSVSPDLDLDLDIDIDLDIDLDKERILPGALKNSEPKSNEKEIFITLILNDKTEYPITESLVKEYQELYQAIDVKEELRKMRGWLISNPTKRKTKRGILKFVNGWLSREQDKGYPVQNSELDNHKTEAIKVDEEFIDIKALTEEANSV